MTKNTKSLSLLALSTGILFFATVTANSVELPDVTYEDIEQLNATCPDADNCIDERYIDDLDFYNCNCGEFCSRYDTCCVDSKYRDGGRKGRSSYNCAKAYGTKLPILMIESCDPEWFGDNHTEELCVASAEENNDLFLALPVTNHKTGVTYRNYYCAICNNETEREHLTLWNLSLTSKTEDVMNASSSELHFFHTENVWIIGNETDHTSNVKVKPVVTVPDQIKEMVHECVFNVISGCAEDWNDTVVEHKCAAYMAILRVTASDGYRKTYRNPHCVICNHESLNRKYCSSTKNFIKQTILPSNTFFVRLFSMYDKESKCDDDKVYDTIAKKCRKVYKG